MTGQVPDGGARQQSFSEVVAEARSTVERLAKLREKTAQVSVTDTSPDGAITVTVDAGGVLTGLRITDQLTGRPGARIAEQVLATIRRAQSRIAGTMTGVLRDTVGDDEEIVDHVLAVYRERFPEPVRPNRTEAVDELRIAPSAPEPVPAPMAVPRRVRPPRRSADEGWENPDQPIMREF